MEHGLLIHLDNNFLTSLPDRWSLAHRQTTKWLLDGHRIGTSAIAWTEFLRGQSNNQRDKEEIRHVKEEMLKGGIAPFGTSEAATAAYLFNVAGRPKALSLKLRMDCMIAACAIEARALLATADSKDFIGFQRYGLDLAEITVR
jgi:predicted nucleic acid-binding protein